MSAVLADLGGTNLRLARAGSDETVRYKIADHPDFETVLQNFAPDIDALYLAAAIQPRGGIIEDTRFAERSHWRIDLASLQKKFSLKRLVVLNDLEAAAHSLAGLNGSQLKLLLAADHDNHHFDHPPKLLVSVGTGIGHACLFEKAGHRPIVQRSHGGHIPALALSPEQKDIAARISLLAPAGRDLIVEDIVSGTGYGRLLEITDQPTALRLFWEFLGLYCNTLVSVAGAYGGVYLTGGVVKEMIAAEQENLASFTTYFHRPMVPVVMESLAATPVYSVLEDNMPIAGLRMIAETQ